MAFLSSASLTAATFCAFNNSTLLVWAEDSVGARVHAHGRNVAPPHDAVGIDHVQGPLAHALFDPVDVIRPSHRTFGFEVGEQGEVQVPLLGEGQILRDGAQDFRKLLVGALYVQRWLLRRDLHTPPFAARDLSWLVALIAIRKAMIATIIAMSSNKLSNMKPPGDRRAWADRAILT